MGILTLVSSFRLSLLLLLLACLRLQPSLQISNGTPASVGEFPFVVQLLISVLSNGTHSTYANCGGSILAANVVLTAAHCVHAAQENELKIHVIAGDLWRRRRWNESEHRTSHSQTASVSKIVVPAKYRPAKFSDSEESLDSLLSPYDLALLILNHNLSFDEHIQPVALVDYSQAGAAGVGLQICGWGYETECHHPYLLRKASVPFDQEQGHCFDRLYKRASHLLGANHDLMRRMQDSPRYLQDSEESDNSYEDVSAICVSDHNGANVCRGDSGSPLVCILNHTKYVCGIASWALSGHCGVVGASAVFTDVGQFIDWIQEQVPELKQSGINIRSMAKTRRTIAAAAAASSSSSLNSSYSWLLLFTCLVVTKMHFQQINKPL